MTRDTFVETWPAISEYLGRSERWCRNMSRRITRPLPVVKMGGLARLYESDIVKWLRDEAANPLGPPPTKYPRRPGSKNFRHVSVRRLTHLRISYAARQARVGLREYGDKLINAMLDKVGAP
jgi:hypothetical protein